MKACTLFEQLNSTNIFKYQNDSFWRKWGWLSSAYIALKFSVVSTYLRTYCIMHYKIQIPFNSKKSTKTCGIPFSPATWWSNNGQNYVIPYKRHQRVRGRTFGPFGNSAERLTLPGIDVVLVECWRHSLYRSNRYSPGISWIS